MPSKSSLHLRFIVADYQKYNRHRNVGFVPGGSTDFVIPWMSKIVICTPPKCIIIIEVDNRVEHVHYRASAGRTGVRIPCLQLNSPVSTHAYVLHNDIWFYYSSKCKATTRTFKTTITVPENCDSMIKNTETEILTRARNIATRHVLKSEVEKLYVSCMYHSDDEIYCDSDEGSDNIPYWMYDDVYTEEDEEEYVDDY